MRGERLGLVGLDRLLRALDQGDDVAHAEDAAGDPLGMEGLELVDRLAGAGELDRLAGDRAHRQRGAAAGVAVHAGEDHAGELDLVGEALGDVDRVLAGHRVGDEQNLLRLRDFGDGLHLVHQRLIDVEAARGVEHQHVIALQPGGIERAAGDVDRRLAGDDRQRRDLGLAAEHGELLLRGRAGDVERGHQDLLAVLLGQPLGELGGGGRLARALQADHHDHRRRRDREVEPRLLGAKHLDQRIVDDLDDLLARRDRAKHLLADRLLGRAVDELAHDRQRDVGLEQGDANLAHRAAHVGLVQRAAAAQAVEDAAQTIAQALEHALLRHAPNEKRRRAKPRRPACVDDASKLTLIGMPRT